MYLLSSSIEFSGISIFDFLSEIFVLKVANNQKENQYRSDDE